MTNDNLTIMTNASHGLMMKQNQPVPYGHKALNQTYPSVAQS